jgi:hypothetical protein
MNRLLTFGTTLVVAVAAAAAEKPPQVQSAGAREVRTTGESKAGLSSWSETGLIVFLRVDGLDQPARLANIVLTEAKDDAGTDLLKQNGAGGDNKIITELPNVTRPLHDKVVEDVPKAFYAQVNLRMSARQAQRIASLKGEVRVSVGGGEKPAVVTVPAVKALGGKKVEHPDLARAGLTLQVAEQGPQEQLELALMISGEVPRDSDVSVVGADGKSVSTGCSGSSGKNAIQQLMKLQRPLNDTDRLRITLPLGQKKVTIPFDLKDIELP